MLAIADYDLQISLSAHKTALVFRDVIDSDTIILQDIFKRYPSQSCDFSVGGVLLWKNHYKYQIAIVRDTLFIKGFSPELNKTIFYRPIGDMTGNASLCMIRDYCKTYNINAELIWPMITDDDRLPNDCEFMNDWREYVYDINKFVSFSGKMMEKKRNHLNYFHKTYPNVIIEEINERNCDELIAFTQKFASFHNDNELARYESNEVIKVLSDFKSYPFIGFALRLNEEIIGYTYGEIIGETLFSHVEKGDLKYRGVYQELASLLCRMALQDYNGLLFVNREDDMGNDSLRQSKLSYHPMHFISKRRFPIITG